MQMTSTISINAPVEKVFDVFTNLDKTPEYVSGITSLEVLEGPAQLAVGTKWKETRTVFGKEATETMWITELTTNKHYAVAAESHGTKYLSNISFKEVEGGTEVTWNFEGNPQTLAAKAMSVIGLLFAGATKKLLVQDLEDLKKACEA